MRCGGETAFGHGIATESRTVYPHPSDGVMRRSVIQRSCSLMLLLYEPAAACSNLLIGKDASGTGSPQIAYTSDAGFQYGASE